MKNMWGIYGLKLNATHFNGIVRTKRRGIFRFRYFIILPEQNDNHIIELTNPNRNRQQSIEKRAKLWYTDYMIKTVTGRNILIVEDNKEISDEFSEYFRKRNNEVYAADTLKAAKRILNEKILDAVILDIILPDGDGLDLFSEFNKLPPVIIMTTLGTDFDIIDGLSTGAADYVVKPCKPEVLEVRLALRLIPKPAAVISVRGITVDITERTAKYSGNALSLTGSEFNILYFFMTHTGVFFSAAEIYEQVWHAPSLRTTTIKYHISNLRQKLLAATGKNMIVTQFGNGYALMPEDPR